MGTRAIWPLSWQRPLFPKIRPLPFDKGRDFEDPLVPSRIRTDNAFGPFAWSPWSACKTDDGES